MEEPLIIEEKRILSRFFFCIIFYLSLKQRILFSCSLKNINNVLYDNEAPQTDVLRMIE